MTAPQDIDYPGLEARHPHIMRPGLAGRFEARAIAWFRKHGVTEVERWIVAGNERPRQIWSARGYRPERLLLRKAL